MAYISPTGFVDSGSGWTLETKAYDGSTGTDARSSEILNEWTQFLELTHAAMLCSKVRFMAYGNPAWSPVIDIDVYYSGEWYHLYQGSWTNNTWVEKLIGSVQTITAFRFRIQNNSAVYGGYASIWEVQFYECVLATVTTPAVTDILSTTATGNGNITAIGSAAPTKRGICWNTTGSPTIADNKVEETGTFGTGAFTAAMTGLSPGQLYYVKAYAYNEAGYGYSNEVNFTTLKVAPTVTVQTPTVILPTTVTANGNITALGGENAITRGFKYGLTKTDTWDAHDDGDFEAGAYTKGLTGLTANTTYWIRAYAVNSIGTSYSEWIEFQTAAVGIIPTGTKIDICSDYSACTYKLQRAETDDGFPYTAYFVISTDLTDKQGLAFYKRILDLHLYFRSEASGYATVEVKRDSEANWQSVGTVSLTGEEEIIVPHLAPDIRAKHFLFKILGTNPFRFLGCLYEYIPEGMR